MIQKIQASEYLKRLDNMTAEERDDYMKRVGEWLQTQVPLLMPKMEEEVARFQNVIQCSAMWNDEECRAFTDGARLLTALVPSHDTWLPDMLYVKAAKRAIKQVILMLGETAKGRNNGESGNNGLDGLNGLTEAHQPSFISHQPSSISHQPSAPFRDIPVGNNEGEGEKMSEVRGKMEDGTLNHDPLTVNQGLPPARPKHIDQYVHLLPKKTQEHAALVQGLYRELDEAREKMRLLADDPTASPRDREAWAKKATKCDNALRKIFDELDAEWAKLVEEGRVVVDDLGNARVREEGKVNSEKFATAAELSTPLANREEQGESPSEKRKALRKFLVDTRRGNGATRKEHVKKWKKNFKEYAKLVGEEAYKDEKLLEAAKHYEIDINKLK